MLWGEARDDTRTGVAARHRRPARGPREASFLRRHIQGVRWSQNNSLASSLTTGHSCYHWVRHSRYSPFFVVPPADPGDRRALPDVARGRRHGRDEHGLRLLLGICHAPHRLRPGGPWDDVHHRSRERHRVCCDWRGRAACLVGKESEELFKDMGNTWEYIMADPQLRWMGPEEGVIHIASGARAVGRSSLARLRVADAITKEEALARLEAGYTDEKVMKVGADPADDLRRGKLIRSLIDNPTPLPPNHAPSPPESIAGKNAGPTGAVLIIDANQIWDLDRNVLSTPRALCQS
ncbi:MR-MLE domain-containing protein [Mycena indigotica]|uniref:MR-MLE domain-containing protein n=1 Tax=Mycena indigotica TaxID=2126181 RepID=A0A8H6VWT2_9AGAR|nr:MR-MLE domain-containing protein [Mycena indigotica]KAF7296939.1 MR-MLE domain-containing protein [Mycena indigotica]